MTYFDDEKGILRH